jgi:hypothetical protein
METTQEVTNALSVAGRLNGGDIFQNHPSHHFIGFDSRCLYCDCRPFGRHAPKPCPDAH